jgi:hypothetical protein
MSSMRKYAFMLILLTLIVWPLAALAQQDATPVNLGDTVEGSLETGQLSAPYTLSGNRGDVVTITLESDDFDTYLTLLDPGLNEIAANDDSDGSSNSSIVDVTLSTSGDFTILVDSYNRLQTGNYSLSVSGTAAPESTETPEATAVVDNIVFDTDLAIGDSINGTVTPDASGVAYTFEGSTGQRVTIDLTSSTFDSYLILQDDSGDELAADDDSGGNLNAQIADFELPENGTYTVLVSSYGGDAEGAFTLSVQEAGTTPIEATPTMIPTPENPVTPQPPVGDSILINIGDTTSSSIAEAAGPATFVFDGSANQMVTITLESNVFDAYVQLLDADGQVVAEDDDSAGNLNARISDALLTEDGRYTINVSSFSGSASGDFTLTLEEAGFGDVPTLESGTPTPTPSGETINASSGAINIGDTVNGTLPEDTRAALFTFEGSAGDVVTITLTSSDFDSYLSLKNEDGQEVAYDDDSAGNLNARITNLPLPSDGTYTIEATSFGSFVSGAFTLTLEAGGGIQATATPTVIISEGGAISLGDTINGALTDENNTASYTFEGNIGQIVRLTLESEDFDPYLSLMHPSGVEIASDDDSAGDLNARIADFELPTNGMYIITVSSASGHGQGEFTLSTTSAAIQPTVEPTPVISAPGTISMGETIASTLTDGPNAHTFEGQAGQVVTIELDSVDFDAYLQLKDADESELASDDDGAGNLNALIENFTLPTDGTYTIVVSSFDNTATGDYSLSLTDEGGETPPITPTAVPSGSDIAIGDTVSGNLSGNDLTASYTFEGEAGQIVTITATAEDFDAYLRLLDPDGDELTTDDDSAGSLNARISFYQLPSNGTYTIVVESFDSAGGSYNLSLSAAEIENIEYTQTVNGILSEAESTAGYRFTGQEGDVITILLQSSVFDTYLSLTQADSEDSYPLMTDDDSGGGSDSRIGPFTLPETGDYIITVSSYDASVTGAYTLTLDRAILSPIAFDETVEVDITAESNANYFQFEGLTGDVISVRADSGGSVDTSLSLTGPDNYEIISDDDSGTDFDPEISRVVLTADGTYTLALLPYAAGDSGQVSLTLTRSPIRSLDDGPQEIRLNEKVTQDVVNFTAVAGEQYQLWIQVQGGTSSPSVTITQNGETVATASADSSTALLVAFITPEDGLVNVQITDYSYEKVVMSVRVETVGE